MKSRGPKLKEHSGYLQDAVQDLLTPEQSLPYQKKHSGSKPPESIRTLFRHIIAVSHTLQVLARSGLDSLDCTIDGC